MKRLILLSMILIALSISAQAAEVTTHSTGNKVIITSVDTGDDDWTWSDTFTGNYYERLKGIPIQSIVLTPGAANDEVIMYDGPIANGVQLPSLKSTDGEERVYYLDGQVTKLIIDSSASTLSSGHRITVVLAK